MAYRDEVVRLSIRQVAASYPPRTWRSLEYVVLEAGPARERVEIVEERAAGSFSGQRRWLRCPRCGRRTQVLGVITPPPPSEPTWMCARRGCGEWKSRKAPRLRNSKSRCDGGTS